MAAVGSRIPRLCLGGCWRHCGWCKFTNTPGYAWVVVGGTVAGVSSRTPGYAWVVVGGIVAAVGSRIPQAMPGWLLEALWLV